MLFQVEFSNNSCTNFSSVMISDMIRSQKQFKERNYPKQQYPKIVALSNGSVKYSDRTFVKF